MAYALKQIKSVVRTLKEDGGGLDDVVDALLEQATLPYKMRAFWEAHLSGKPIVMLEAWMLKHIQWRGDRWRWRIDKKTIKALKKAGVVVDPEDWAEALDGLIEKGLVVEIDLGTNEEDMSGLTESEIDIATLWGVDIIRKSRDSE